METVYIEISGLMEHEGRTSIDIWGEGEGNNIKEICEDIIKKNPEKGKDFHSEGINHCWDWGFRLFLERRKEE